jgi:hypothetical protein
MMLSALGPLVLAGCLSNGSAGSPDVDRDGYAASEDCDDRDAAVHPDAVEVCNGVDDDCDGTLDADSQTGIYWSDEDGDGYGTAGGTLSCEPGEGFVEDTTDCDDTEAGVHPGATETCNSRDDDCDGERDEDAGLEWHLDEDGDGWGVDELFVTTCIAPTGYVDESGDCDDTNDRVNPGASEVCGDDLDNDCDELVDADDTEVEIVTWYLDADLDEWGTDKTTVKDCTAPFGYVREGGDCNDTVSAINPEALEVCDDQDNDCDEQVDEPDALGAATWYFDGDNDGYGIPGKTTLACTEPPFYAPNDDDCDDAAFVTHPGAAELCDDEDNDCDITIDEGTENVHWYRDADKDTYGDPDVTLFDCEPIAGYVLNRDDCDDTDDSIHPDGIEECNGDDDDCNGTTDDDAIDATTCRTDADGDGYGTPEIAYEGCSPPSTCESTTSDCDDTRADVNPGRLEVCDADDVDENCNALWEDADPGTDPKTEIRYFPDADHDTYGDESATGTLRCDVVDVWETTDSTDCDDGAFDVNPAAQEVCDDADVDEDCDGLEDIDDASVIGTTTAYTDADGDDYGDVDDPGFPACEETTGVSFDHTDCDDGVVSTHPDAKENDNGVDDDCDEWIDEATLVGGELILSEFLPNPSDTDAGREWFELYNPTKVRTVYLDGWQIMKDDDMEPRAFFVPPEAGLWIGPGERLLFCEDAAAFEAEAVSATCDYEYGTTSNGLADSIYGPATASTWDFHGSYDSLHLIVDTLTIDVVVWDMDDWTLIEGHASTLSESHLDATSNDDLKNWCIASELYDTGGDDTGGPEPDYGTPGTAGSCP